MICSHSGCAEENIYLSQYCWLHTPDKFSYRETLTDAIHKENKNLCGINLKKADLSGMDLKYSQLFDSCLDNSELVGVDLSGCDLTHCSMKNADLTKANLSEARLWNADLTGANLSECNMTSADLWNAKLFNVKLWHANLLTAKSISRMSFLGASGRLDKPRIDESGGLSAEESYRDLKAYFLSRGMYTDASWASFNEKSMERIIMRKNGDLNYLPSLAMNIMCGYGEKPYRIILTSLFTIIFFGLIYSSYSAIEPSGAGSCALTWSDYLYYSTITFTTVGYGDIVPKANGVFRLIAGCEAFIGVFFTGLFIFTLARKYSAR